MIKQTAISILIALAIALPINYAIGLKCESSIEKWAQEKNLSISDLDRQYFNIGPFSWWMAKNHIFYKAKMKDGSVYWIRKSLFYTDIEKETSNGYVTIK